MNILVTGGAGFIGSHVVDALVQRQHTVLVVDNLSTGREKNLSPQATFVTMDLNDPGLSRVIADFKPQVVYHLAAQIDVRKSVANPMADAQDNIIASLNLLQACVAHGVKKVIFSSTGGAIYGETDQRPTPEDFVCQPESPYGIAKKTIEMYLRFFHHVHGLDYVVLRYSNVYGPRQNDKGEAGVITLFTTRLLQNQPISIFGDGSSTRDYVYVGDVALANVLALEFPGPEIFNIGTGKETSIAALAQQLITATGSTQQPQLTPARAGEIQHSCINPAKAQHDLLWHAQVGLEQGIAQTVEWFKTETT